MRELIRKEEADEYDENESLENDQHISGTTINETVKHNNSSLVIDTSLKAKNYFDDSDFALLELGFKRDPNDCNNFLIILGGNKISFNSRNFPELNKDERILLYKHLASLRDEDPSKKQLTSRVAIGSNVKLWLRLCQHYVNRRGMPRNATIGGLLDTLISSVVFEAWLNYSPNYNSRGILFTTYVTKYAREKLSNVIDCENTNFKVSPQSTQDYTALQEIENEYCASHFTTSMPDADLLVAAQSTPRLQNKTLKIIQSYRKWQRVKQPSVSIDNNWQSDDEPQIQIQADEGYTMTSAHLKTPEQIIMDKDSVGVIKSCVEDLIQSYLKTHKSFSSSEIMYIMVCKLNLDGRGRRQSNTIASELSKITGRSIQANEIDGVYGNIKSRLRKHDKITSYFHRPNDKEQKKLLHASYVRADDYDDINKNDNVSFENGIPNDEININEDELSNIFDLMEKELSNMSEKSKSISELITEYKEIVKCFNEKIDSLTKCLNSETDVINSMRDDIKIIKGNLQGENAINPLAEKELNATQSNVIADVNDDTEEEEIVNIPTVKERLTGVMINDSGIDVVNVSTVEKPANAETVDANTPVKKKRIRRTKAQIAADKAAAEMAAAAAAASGEPLKKKRGRKKKNVETEK